MGKSREVGWLIVVLRFPSDALKNSALALDPLPMANPVTKDPKLVTFKQEPFIISHESVGQLGSFTYLFSCESNEDCLVLGRPPLGQLRSPCGLVTCTHPTCLPGRLARACSQASLHIFPGQSQRNQAHGNAQTCCEVSVSVQFAAVPLAKKDTWFSPESQRNWSYKATGRPQIEAINATNPPQNPNMYSMLQNQTPPRDQDLLALKPVYSGKKFICSHCTSRKLLGFHWETGSQPGEVGLRVANRTTGHLLHLCLRLQLL